MSYENVDQLKTMALEDLVDHFGNRSDNIVKAFNQVIDAVRRKGLKKHNRKTLHSYHSEMIGYMNGFEDYQRAFFYHFARQQDQKKRENTQEFLISSEMYFNRANTMVNQLNNEITTRDARFAIWLGAAGIIFSVLLFVLPYAYHPEDETLLKVKQQTIELRKLQFDVEKLQRQLARPINVVEQKPSAAQVPVRKQTVKKANTQ